MFYHIPVGNPLPFAGGREYHLPAAVHEATVRGHKLHFFVFHEGGNRWNGPHFMVNGEQATDSLSHAPIMDRMAILKHVKDAMRYFIDTYKPHEFRTSANDTRDLEDRTSHRSQAKAEMYNRFFEGLGGEINRSGNYFSVLFPNHPHAPVFDLGSEDDLFDQDLKESTSFKDILDAMARKAKRKRSGERAAEMFDYIQKRRGGESSTGDENQFHNLIPTAFADTYDLEMEPGHLRIMKVPLHMIRSQQATVGLPQVKAKARGDFRKIYGSYSTPQGPMLIYDKGDNVFHLVDGNHMVNAALAKGETHIQARTLFPKSQIPNHLKEHMPINKDAHETM